MPEPRDPVLDRSPVAAATSEQVTVEDLLIAATDDDLDRALDRFVSVAHAQIGAPLGVVLHPALGGATWTAGDAGHDLFDVVRTRDRRRGRVYGIDETSGRLLGWLVVDRTDHPEGHDDLIRRLVRLLGQTLGRHAIVGGSPGAGHRDSLTGLANRLGVETALWTAASDRTAPWSMIVLHIGGPYPEADAVTEHELDEVRAVVADRLRGAVRDADLVARVEQDVFVVLTEASGAEVDRLLERAAEVVEHPVATLTGVRHLDARVGHATAWTPERLPALLSDALDRVSP